MTSTTAETRKLYQQVAATVVEAIDKGTYRTGHRLPSERDLAEELGVSRPTVREAMIALEIRGIVEARHGSGIYVVEKPPVAGQGPELDIGAFELTEARRLFEGEACALAATIITDEELKELETLLAAMQDQHAYRGSPAGEFADRQFHVAIAKATKNAAILSVIENLWDLRYRSPLCATMLERARLVESRPLIDDHREVLDALWARSPQRARDAMRHHLGRVIEDLLTATELDAVSTARSEIDARRSEMARRTAI